MAVSLCFPDKEKSCFACCPPIRPAGYEHIHYKNIIQRTLRENSQGLENKGEGLYPITGFSCWALGYVSDNHKLVGCMLHPARNKGADLRYRIDYGDKCRRESCQEEQIFSRLKNNERIFWLHLADGLDSFTYSSREFNPLFKMMGWGTELLKIISLKENGKANTRDSFFASYPIFMTRLKPRGNAYLLKRVLDRGGMQILSEKSLKKRFEEFSAHISGRLKNEYADTADGSFTHHMDLDPDFLDFLRLSAEISRIEKEDAIFAKEIVDNELDSFIKKI